MFVDNQAKIKSAFAAAFAKMQVLGNDVSQMVDCSEVLPIPPTTPVPAAHLPAGKTMNDIEQAVSIHTYVVDVLTDACFIVCHRPVPVSFC